MGAVSVCTLVCSCLPFNPTDTTCSSRQRTPQATPTMVLQMHPSRPRSSRTTTTPTYSPLTMPSSTLLHTLYLPSHPPSTLPQAILLEALPLHQAPSSPLQRHLHSLRRAAHSIQCSHSTTTTTMHPLLSSHSTISQDQRTLSPSILIFSSAMALPLFPQSNRKTSSTILPPSPSSLLILLLLPLPL